MSLYAIAKFVDVAIQKWPEGVARYMAQYEETRLVGRIDKVEP